MSSTGELGAKLQDCLDCGVEEGLPGISAAIAGRAGLRWTGVSGLADINSHRYVRSDMLYGVGSITKTFIAVIVLQLAEEGHLQLHHTVADVLGAAAEGVPNAEFATIAQLLRHTSGVPSWEDNPTWIRDGRGASLDVERIWDKTDALSYIAYHPPIGLPGEKFSYSNSNYTLLGLIIEKATGQDLVREIKSRILEPLSLKDVYLEGFEPVPQDRLPHRYHWATANYGRVAGLNDAFREVRPGLIDVTCSNLSVEWAAGGIVATAGDLAVFGAALRDGKLLLPQSMRVMADWSTIDKNRQIGHNLFREQQGHFTLIGHDGGVLGFSATLYWIERADAVVVAMSNVGNMHSGEVRKTLTSVVKRADFLETILRFASSRL